MHIFSYVITHDSGFAPNPFGGFLTLATCKPRIRSQASKGDFIVGTGSSRTVGSQTMVYAAQISDVITLEEYGSEEKYQVKRPASRSEWWRKHGDNIYVNVDGKWTQRRNVHHFEKDVEHDLSGKNVLVCQRFWYFGENAIEIPNELTEIIKTGPGHKRIKDRSFVKQFVNWLNSLPEGIHGDPEMKAQNKTGCTQPVGQ